MHLPSILNLTSSAIRPWLLDIQCESGSLGITAEMNYSTYSDPPNHSLGLTHAKVCALMSAIINSLPREICSQVITARTTVKIPNILHSVRSAIHRTSALGQRSLNMRA